jgi:hypothetical protein
MIRRRVVFRIPKGEYGDELAVRHFQVMWERACTSAFPSPRNDLEMPFSTRLTGRHLPVKIS